MIKEKIRKIYYRFSSEEELKRFRSPIENVAVFINTYGCRTFTKAKEKELLTYAEFPVDPSYGYVRVTVVGDKGQKANTNAYFLDEIMNEEEENS
jgi:hypothetical protein